MAKRTPEQIEEHKKQLRELYINQLEEDEYGRNTTFMKAVLTEAIRQTYFSWSDPKKIEDWVVRHEKEIYTTKTFKLK